MDSATPVTPATAAADSGTPPLLAQRTPETTSPPAAGGSAPVASGFIPGQSEEERMQAKRDKWKAQKQNQRLKKLAAAGGLPPPLPSRSIPVFNSPLPPRAGVDGQPVTADGAKAADALALVDWTPEEIAEITDELIEALDEHDKSAACKAATLANLESALVKEIEDDAAMPIFCKKIFKRCIPKMTAKALNSSGLPSEHKDSGFVALAVLYYLYSKFSTKKRIKELIAKAHGPVTPQAETTP